MFLDLNTGALADRIDCDVCVVGSGPAGLAIARSFAGSKQRLCILESGGFTHERDVQHLYQGESVGYALANGLEGSRSRFFGGSANCWAGACTPLDAIDFEKRSWVPNSGWPISNRTLSPFAEATQKFCLIGPPIFDERLFARAQVPIPSFSKDTLEFGYWQFCAEPRLGAHYRQTLERADNVTVVLHATVTRIESSAGEDHVTSITARSLAQRSVTVNARFYVLATGGIENARLLLSNGGAGSPGLGNARGLVGRYFMDHPVCIAASVLPMDGATRTLDALNVFHEPAPEIESTRFKFVIKPSRTFQEKHQILNSAVFLSDHDAEFSEGLMAAVRLRKAYHERRIPADAFGDALKVLLDMRNVTRAAYGRYLRYGSNRSRLGIKIQAETVPDPESRVTLSNRLDTFGQRLPKLDWRLGHDDRRSIDVLLRKVQEEFRRVGLAEVRLDRWLNDGRSDFPDDLRSGVHHSGTTRMSDQPQTGVVDQNCRVHSIENLYVAGSSVFPTNSWANPTWTISCLAMRLAAHLQGRLETGN